MHLITGMVLSLLASRRFGGTNSQTPFTPLLRSKGPVETVHLMKGRVRFRVPKLEGSKENGAFVEENLAKLPGVRSVETNHLNGSVLICFDEEDLSADLLFTALIKMLGLEKELEAAPRAVLVREAEEVGRTLNKSIYDTTGGMVDLRTAMLFFLLYLGVRKVLSERGNALPPGFTMLWWAGTLLRLF
jgi:hypothetical protein